IAAGDELGMLIVEIPDMGEMRLPLVAGADVAEGGFTVRATASAQRLMNMVLGSAREAMN
ncbi:MAG: D-alanyl-D-alanine carboxypeptidase, partial [Roseinatronobacter sp.]